MSEKTKRTNKTETEIREELEMKKLMEEEKAFWAEIKEVETKHNRKIRAFIDPNRIMYGIIPVISSTVVEHVEVGTKEDTTKKEKPVV